MLAPLSLEQISVEEEKDLARAEEKDVPEKRGKRRRIDKEMLMPFLIINLKRRRLERRFSSPSIKKLKKDLTKSPSVLN